MQELEFNFPIKNPYWKNIKSIYFLKYDFNVIRFLKLKVGTHY